jgi:hypothetical protein
LGFINDPSAWIMDIGDTKDLIYCLSLEVPLIIFVIMLFLSFSMLYQWDSHPCGATFSCMVPNCHLS